MEDSPSPSPSDEEMRKLLKPNCDDGDVESVLKESFANPEQEVKIIRSLDSYDDQNFMALIGNVKFLVKVHNGVESKDFVDAYNKADKNYDDCTSVVQFQNAIMSKLNSSGVCTSNPQISRKTGLPLAVCKLPVVSKEHSPCSLVIKLLSWVPGRTMSSLKALPIECLANAGAYLAKVHLSLDQLDASKHPSAQRFHAWDGKNTLAIRDFTHAIQDARKRSLVESIISTFKTDILDSGVGQQFRKAILQGDFNDANIIVDEECQVSGAIDFGDSVESWRILDLSVGMAYASLTVYGKQNKSIAAMAAMLRAYSKDYPLEEIELKHLHLLVACRLACSVTLGAFSYQQNPGNEYLLLHAKPAWDALELIWGYEESQRQKMKTLLSSVFAQACNTSYEGLTDLEFPDPSIPDVLCAARITQDELSSKRQKLK